jgi:FMN reductase
MTRPASAIVQDRGPTDGEPVRLVVVSAGVSDPSSTRMLADRVAQKSLDLLRQAGTTASASVIELGPLAVDIARATVAGFPGEQLQAAIEQVAAADALIASTPVYKAGISGLFKSFVDVIDDDLLVTKPVLLAATAGSSRHALVIDEQMRPLFAYLRALTLPTSVFAAPEDWAATELGGRIERAATELAVILRAGVGQQIADRTWSGYRHQFAGNATRAESTTDDVDFDSPLMRLAAGGTTRQPAEPDDSTDAGALTGETLAPDGRRILARAASSLGPAQNVGRSGSSRE